MKLLDGKKISAELKSEIAEKVKNRIKNGKKQPHLAVILIGNDGGSETYVRNKAKACELVGFKSTTLIFDDTISEKELLSEVEKLNTNPDIDGFIVQLPLPKHINENKIIEAVSPEKDADGFHPVNIGKMLLGQDSFIPATPMGILELLSRYNIKTEGKHCVILGRSNIVGKPLAMLMAQKSYPGNATVTLCHSRTENLQNITKQADILIVAMGQPEFITADMVKKGAVVIDVGTTRVKSDNTKSGWKLTGDVKFDEVAPKCSYITPVPGGVGPMTIASLLKNTLKAVERKI